MQDLVVWTGPVADFQVPGATVPGARELFIGCCGDLTPPCKPPTCPTIGEQVRGDPGRLAERAGMAPENVSDLFLGAFSAGGSILKRCLTNPAYRRAATAVMLSDATYTASWVDPGARIPPAVEGYVQYGVDVVNGPGDKLFVATASPAPNKHWATGVENLAAIRREIEKRTGKVFEPLDHFYGVTPGPERAFKLGNVIFGEYPLKPLGHNHPAIAPQKWQKILQPWLHKGKGPVDSAGGIDDEPDVRPPENGGEPNGARPAGGLTVADWLTIGAITAGGVYVGYRFAKGRRR